MSVEFKGRFNTSGRIIVATTGGGAVNNDPYWDKVSLLIRGDGSIVDSSSYAHPISVLGNTSISTTQVKYGTGSVYFDGSGDALRITAAPSLDLRSGDFTIEAWVNYSGSGLHEIYGQWGFIQGTFHINAGKLVYYWAPYSINTYLMQTSISVPGNQWAHCAVTRSGSTWRLFVNGVLGATATFSGNATGTVDTYIGAYMAPGIGVTGYMKGYLDDLRITKGAARYVSNFTPPTASF